MKMWQTALWSLAIGLFIMLIGLVLYWTMHKPNLEYWFIGLGALLVIAAGLPFLGGSSAAKEDILYRQSSYMDDYNQSRRGFALSRWTVITFLIGLPNLIIPLLLIHF